MYLFIISSSITSKKKVKSHPHVQKSYSHSYHVYVSQHDLNKLLIFTLKKKKMQEGCYSAELLDEKLEEEQKERKYGDDVEVKKET